MPSTVPEHLPLRATAGPLPRPGPVSITVAPWAGGLAARWSEAAEKGSRLNRTPPAGLIDARSYLPTRFPVWAAKWRPSR